MSDDALIVKMTTALERMIAAQKAEERDSNRKAALQSLADATASKPGKK